MIDSVSEKAGAGADLMSAKTDRQDRNNVDRLPPNDIPAEKATLGAILSVKPGAAGRVKECQLQFGTDEVFYDLRNQEIWHAMEYLVSRDLELDVITLQSELTSRGKLEQVGGINYLCELQNAGELEWMLPQYVQLVWSAFVARSLVRDAAERVGIVYETNGVSEAFLARIEEGHQRWLKLLERGAVSPKNLCCPADFGDAYYDVWFNRQRETYGWELPFKFPMRIRPSEMTLFTGDNGSGKSSLLGQVAIVCAKQFKGKEMVVIASMEVPPEITLWIMARQILGVGYLEKTPANEKRIASALAWLNERILLYNFLGITDWRDLLHTFEYARDHHAGTIFIVDSVMRIGIPDDDYALQGMVAMRFADFAVKKGAHVFLVVHENKGDGNQKNRVRGSKQWTDNAHNVCAIKRNEQKAERVEEWKAEQRAGRITQAQLDEKLAEVRSTWDSKFILNKQRWPGSQQNASRWLYFDRSSLQFHEYPDDEAKNYLL